MSLAAKEQSHSPWNWEFDALMDKFITTASPADLLRAVVSFRCYGREQCMSCPLSSGRNGLGKASDAWKYPGRCGLKLCLNDTLTLPSPGYAMDFSMWGGRDGKVERALSLQTGKFTHEHWFTLRSIYLANHRSELKDQYEALRWGCELFNVEQFMFEFLPIWLNRSCDE